MTPFSRLTLRNFLIASHDALATAFALLASFYLRFEGGEGFFIRLPRLLYVLPYFVAFSVVVCYLFNLTTTKWRFISLPDALNILRVASVLTVALVVVDYVFIFVAPSIHGGQVFFGRVTIVLYWFLEIFSLSALRFAYRYFRYSRTRQHARADVRDVGRVGGKIGAHIGDGIDLQREEMSFVVERQPGIGDVVTALRIAEEMLAALGNPFH